jgi:hypothetical protein
MSIRRPTGRDRRGQANLIFSPKQMPGLVGWWDASVGVSTTGALIDSIADQSGNGYTLASTGANRLTLVSGALNSRSAAEANGAQLYARVLGPAQSSDPFWICCVAQVTTLSTANNQIFGHNSIGANKGFAIWGTGNTATNRSLRNEGVGNFDDGAATTSYEVMSAYCTGTAPNMTRVMRINGTQQFSSGSTNLLRTNGSQYLQIGEAFATGSRKFRFIEGAIGHGTVDDVTIRKLEAYFAAKDTGITIS